MKPKNKPLLVRQNMRPLRAFIAKVTGPDISNAAWNCLEQCKPLPKSWLS